MKNQTLRKHLVAKINKLAAKIKPHMEEMELAEKMIDQLDAYEASKKEDAQNVLEFNKEEEQCQTQQ